MPTEIVIAGAGYAGVQIGLRLADWLKHRADVKTRLVDQHDYHSLITELPDVAAGERPAADARMPLPADLTPEVGFVQTRITGLDLAGHRLLTETEPIPYTRLVLALGSQPNSFGIQGIAEHALDLYSVDDAAQVWTRVKESVAAPAQAEDRDTARRLLTALVGGGGATGVEIAGDLAEQLPALARERGLAPELARVVVVERGPRLLDGESSGLQAKASDILAQLGVDVRTGATIAACTADGFTLADGTHLDGALRLWAGGVKAPDVITHAGLPTAHNSRIAVDATLRVVGRPEVYVVGDLALVDDPETGRPLAPLAQNAIDEGNTVATNLRAELEGHPLTPFVFHSKGFVVGVGRHGGVADVAGRAVGGRLAHTLRDAIDWEYRQSVTHLHGRAAL